jgi:lycopene cyclase domain-containing protein
MERASWTYGAILVLSLLYPLAQSFEWRVTMHKRFRFIIPGILATALVYIPWDVWFTRMGIWGFNHNYTRDFYLGGLPIEEWLFFIVIPYCCFFLFEVLRFFVKRFYFPRISLGVIIGLLAIFGVLIILYHDHTYTVVTVAWASFVLILQLIFKTWKTWFSGFLAMYLLSMVPFIIVNGLLTSIPVVWYNNFENLGIRVWTVPVDDFIYLLGLLLPAIHIYQVLLRRFGDPSLRGKDTEERPSGF